MCFLLCRRCHKVESSSLLQREFRFKHPGDRKELVDKAVRFYKRFSRKTVMLSDGRVVYFAPDLRAKTERGLSNDDAWAEYAIHAVTSSGGKIDGKDYNERLFNRTKAASIWRIENVLKAEHCALENTPNRVNRIAFYGKDDSGRTMRIVTKLDDAGNIYADLSEITVLTGIQKNKIPPLLPLGEVVKTAWERGVVPTVNDNNISKYSAVGKLS